MNIDTNKLAGDVQSILAALKKFNFETPVLIIGELLAVIKQQAEALDAALGQIPLEYEETRDTALIRAALAASAPLVKRFEEAAREKAEAEVLRVRGSYDAPGFDACVDAEMVKLVEGV